MPTQQEIINEINIALQKIQIIEDNTTLHVFTKEDWEAIIRDYKLIKRLATFIENPRLSLAYQLLSEAEIRYYVTWGYFRAVTQKGSDAETKALSIKTGKAALAYLSTLIMYIQAAPASEEEALKIFEKVVLAALKSFDLIIDHHRIEALWQFNHKLDARYEHCRIIQRIAEPLKEQLSLLVSHFPSLVNFAQRLEETMADTHKWLNKINQEADENAKKLCEETEQKPKKKKKKAKNKKKTKKPTLPIELENDFKIEEGKLNPTRTLEDIFAKNPEWILKLLKFKMLASIEFDDAIKNYLNEKGKTLRLTKAIYDELSNALSEISSPDDWLILLSDYSLFKNTQPFTLQDESEDCQVYLSYRGLTFFSTRTNENPSVLHECISQSNVAALKAALEINGGLKFINQPSPTYENKTPLELAIERLKINKTNDTIACVALLLSNAADYEKYIEKLRKPSSMALCL